jgi:integrase
MAAYRRADRDNHWYYRRWVKLPDGRRERIAGKAPLNTKASALEAERAHVERLLSPPKPAPVVAPTVADYAEQWLSKRTNVNAHDDRARLERHALPRLVGLRMNEVKPRHARDLVLDLKAQGKLAPRTIRQVAGLLHTMFKSAAIEEVIAANPIVFERGVLPKGDKDPTWRHQASYTRAEVETLLSDERVLPDRRILYALKALAALRHQEAARLTWGQYDTEATPLGRLALGKTKSGVPREVPVHPTLAKLLAEWKLSGWCAVYGRRPTTDDLIVPTRNMTDERPHGTPRDANEAQRQLLADLGRLELRTKAGTNQKRRGHDLRRTFISLARTDGALDGPLRWVTHGPSVSNMTELYSTFTWAALCTEVAKLKVTLREGTLVPLANTGVDRWLKPAIERARETGRAPGGNQLAAHGGVFVQPLAAIAGMKATPTGFEPVLPA